MNSIIPFLNSDLAKITNHRDGEIKFGQKMQTIPNESDAISFLETCKAKFVILGIPEDVGVRANFGRAGAASCWESTIKSIANIQHNKFCKADSILILGTLNVENEMKEAENLDENNKIDRKKLFKLVENIDKEVAHIISIIIKAKKIPIIIGGGHNNAYGNIKGAALAFGKPINAINFDPHSDFRAKEGRHSGNGFSYAFEEGFLKKYFIFGLHESYNSKKVVDVLKENKSRIQYISYDKIAVQKKIKYEDALDEAYNFIKNDHYGIEIDLDAIPDIPSSAMTPSGFSVEELRHFISFFGKNKNAIYLHICEGAPSLGIEKNNHLIGKLIAYLVSDFIKAKKINTKKPKESSKKT
jgi:formiminoglutamase